MHVRGSPEEARSRTSSRARTNTSHSFSPWIWFASPGTRQSQGSAQSERSPPGSLVLLESWGCWSWRWIGEQTSAVHAEGGVVFGVPRCALGEGRRLSFWGVSFAWSFGLGPPARPRHDFGVGLALPGLVGSNFPAPRTQMVPPVPPVCL